jgi:hypothetical protein
LIIVTSHENGQRRGGAEALRGFSNPRISTRLVCSSFNLEIYSNFACGPRNQQCKKPIFCGGASSHSTDSSVASQRRYFELWLNDNVALCRECHPVAA